MALLFQIFSAFLLGLVGGATPGPILTSCFAESLRKGFNSSLRIMFMSIIAETISILPILILFSSLHIPQIVLSIISMIGIIVLIWLALEIWKIKKINDKGEIFSFQKIFLLVVLNGPYWIFWITVCIPQAFSLKQKIVGGQFLFLLFFEIGWFIATATLTFIFSRFRPLLAKEEVISTVFKILALVLMFFAAKLALDSILFFIK